MRLWISKNNRVSIKDQLTRQIILAITSGDVAAGDKLPSIRELARRYKIHANTAAAACVGHGRFWKQSGSATGTSSSATRCSPNGSAA
ncbi:MAG: GntR family transcriptional regulator [Acidobacteria bacterium]|nr:GntR family transcriptional regulator [Acidobacteriota bacterium]